jgi:hypothetical protein
MDWKYCSVSLRRLAGLGVIIALLATTFAPAMAASQPQPTSSPSFSTKSIAKVMATTSPETRMRADRTTPDAPMGTQAQATKTGAFFKTRTGLAVIAVMAVGTGYAVHSSRRDRIRGSIR